jgi:hypothetical protein
MSRSRYDRAAKAAAEAIHTTNGKAAPPPEPWAKPVPFGRLDDVPPFPVNALPPWLAAWVRAEAEATQTPPDLAGCLSLAIAGAAVARKARVNVRDSWYEPANIFTVVSLPPGDRKSAVYAEAMQPVVEHERAEQERMAPVIAALASAHRILERKLEAAEKAAAKAEDAAEAHKLREEAERLAKELEAHRVPEPPRLFCDDVTPERLTQLIVCQGGRMLLAAAEGTTFEICKGRYSEKANFDVFLKGHAGDPLRTDRTTRDGDAIDNPALSCALAVQPDVISGLAEQSSMRGRGFLARWLYSLPVSKVGRRTTAPAGVPAAVADAYRQGMAALWRFEGNDLAGPGSLWELELSRGAEDAIRALEQWLEPQLAEGEPLAHLAGWGNKLAGACARLGLILHTAGTLGTGGGWNEPVSRETAEAAVTLGRDYFLPHARAAFGLMGTDQRAKDAARVVEWLARLNFETLKPWKGGRVVTKGDIHGKVFGGTRSVEEVSAICRLLCDHGYLRNAGTAWRRDVQVFEVNPTWDVTDENG